MVYIFSGSRVIAEYENGAVPGSPTREYIYSGGMLLAKVEAGATKYYHQDHLSNRVITDSSGTVVAQSGHFPFGENWYESGGINKLKFTSYERDPESGNDYALARYHVNRLGRFNSPDPVAGSIANPQSLNRYAYALNGPTNLTDPLGKDAASPESIAMWWLWNRFNGTGTSWDGDMTGGDFGPAFFEVLDKAMAAYLEQVRKAFSKSQQEELRKRLEEAIQNLECAELLGGEAHAQKLVNRFHIFDVTNSSRPIPLARSGENRRIDDTEGSAWDFTLNHNAAATAPFSRTGNIYVNTDFWSAPSSRQAVILVHELRHQEYGDLDEGEFGSTKYLSFIKAEYAQIEKKCFGKRNK
jgi:RHS repeat-associated protein